MQRTQIWYLLATLTFVICLLLIIDARASDARAGVPCHATIAKSGREIITPPHKAMRSADGGAMTEVDFCPESILVEAVGVEPTSESVAEGENYGRISFQSCSPPAVRTNKTRQRLSPTTRDCSRAALAHHREAVVIGQPARMTPKPGLQANQVERRELIRPRMPVD